VLQSSGAQVTMPRAVQVPAPSQVFGFCDCFFAMHVAAAHGVPATQWRQAPAPSQAPSRPQLAAIEAVQRACGSAAPAATFEQVPRKPGTLQAVQLPQLDDEQQTPSTQLLLSQSEPAPQLAPSGFFRHTAPAQVAGATQSASELHELAHMPFSHA
jgi:hypothetical protein